VRAYPDYRMFVLVEQQSSFVELGQEGLDGTTHGFELLKRDVLLEIGSRPKTLSFDGVV